MGPGWRLRGPGRALWTGRAEGDLGPASGQAGAGRRRAVLDRPWSWLRQEHGARVVRVEQPAEVAGRPGDALVSTERRGALAVFGADCATVALASPEGVVGAVHAGWRGLLGGVVEAAVAEMRELGALTVAGALGPCVHPECNEFSDSDLDRVADRLGAGVRATTPSGAPALDVPFAVSAALERSGAELAGTCQICTACSPGYFSHRARREAQRQALVVWIE